jgi:hypothetical protein
MGIADLFLLLWALSATVFAVYFHTLAERRDNEKIILEIMLIGLMEGTAKMHKTNKGAIFTNQVGDDIDEISIEARQGKGADRP